MNFVRITTILIAILIPVCYKYCREDSQLIESGKYSVVDNFLSETNLKKLQTLCEETFGRITTATQRLPSIKYINIGEDHEPINGNQCNKSHTLFFNQTQRCQFPSELHLGQHFVYTGGYNGYKESISKLLGRLTTFFQFHNDTLIKTNQLYKTIINSKQFEIQRKYICGKSYPYFEPFASHIFLMPPGTLGPLHLDPPYFLNGVNIHSFPLWLLAVIKSSNVFESEFIPQVQAIIYIHDWNNNSVESGGEFILYPKGYNNKPEIISSNGKSAIFSDGSQMIHGVNTFLSNMEPIEINKAAMAVELGFDKSVNEWRLYIDNKPTNQSYSWENIRASIVIRGWCVENKDMINKLRKKWDNNDVTLERVMDILQNDAIKKKFIAKSKWNEMDNYDKGIFLINKYIKLPTSPLKWITFNYCVVFDLFSHWKIIKMFESFIC